MDKTYHKLNAHLESTIKQVRRDIDNIQATQQTTITEIILYLVATITVINSITMAIVITRYRWNTHSYRFHRPIKTSLTADQICRPSQTTENTAL